MVLRRFSLLCFILLGVALAVAGPATSARAQQAATDDDGSSYYQDPGDDSGGWWDDGSTDDTSDYDNGGDDADGSVNGGAPPAGTLPAVTPAPAPTTTTPGTTVPAARQPAPVIPPVPPVDQLPTVGIVRTIPGTVAKLRSDGKAAIPRGAPKAVQQLIAAANQIIGKPYKWGGGHAKLVDRGYDCSGSVSYALIGARLLPAPMVSGTLARWGAHGDGRWISVYANAGHVYMEVAGLRLDTSPVGDATRLNGVRWRPPIGRRTGFHARHPLGL